MVSIYVHSDGGLDIFKSFVGDAGNGKVSIVAVNGRMYGVTWTNVDGHTALQLLHLTV